MSRDISRHWVILVRDVLGRNGCQIGVPYVCMFVRVVPFYSYKGKNSDSFIRPFYSVYSVDMCFCLVILIIKSQ